jgi:hypothetical protein
VSIRRSLHFWLRWGGRLADAVVQRRHAGFAIWREVNDGEAIVFGVGERFGFATEGGDDLRDGVAVSDDENVSCGAGFLRGRGGLRGVSGREDAGGDSGVLHSRLGGLLRALEFGDESGANVGVLQGLGEAVGTLEAGVTEGSVFIGGGLFGVSNDEDGLRVGGAGEEEDECQKYFHKVKTKVKIKPKSKPKS